MVQQPLSNSFGTPCNCDANARACFFCLYRNFSLDFWVSCHCTACFGPGKILRWKFCPWHFWSKTMVIFFESPLFVNKYMTMNKWSYKSFWKFCWFKFEVWLGQKIGCKIVILIYRQLLHDIERSVSVDELLYLVIAKNIVLIFSESKAYRSMFWVLFVKKLF